MAAIQRYWCTVISSLWILATAFVSSVDSVDKDLDEFGPNIYAVTSKSITIKVPCLSSKTCELKSLIFKEIGNSAREGEMQSLGINRIRNLDSNVEHLITSVVLLPNGTYIRKEKIIWTCPEEVPAIRNMRTAKAGPGWLDIRWTPVKDTDCNSNIYYVVKYAPDTPGKEQVFSQEKSYGIITATDGSVLFRPSHPCATWDKEFCLLLTDYVVPGRNHTVIVKPVRFDYDGQEIIWPHSYFTNSTYTKTVYADPTVTGPYTLGQADGKSPCGSSTIGEIKQAPDNNGPEEGRGISQQPITVPVWVIVLSVLLLLCSLSVPFVTWIWQKNRAKSDQDLLPEPYHATSSPPACNKNVNTDRVSEMYDDCLTAVHPLSNSNPATPTHPNLVPTKLFKGKQNSLPKKIAAEAALKAGNANNEEANNKSSAYMIMKPQPIYDDARDVVRNVPETSYSNIPPVARDSNVYMEPEPTSPIYEEAKCVLGRESKASTGYNEAYSHSPDKPWRSWF